MLEGRTVFLSGAGPDLGRSIALATAAQGASVAVAARNVDRCRAIADEAAAFGRRAVAVPLDVTDQTSCDEAVRRCADELGTIDVLVNNAAHFGTFRRLVDAPVDDWRATFEVNFFGTLRLTRAALDVMSAEGDRSIVMINSVVAVECPERLGSYASSKAALAAATKTLARELGPEGIRVNGIHAGYIAGERIESYIAHEAARVGISTYEQTQIQENEAALRCIPLADEIAGSVVYLASTLSSPVTGQSLHVNAGSYMP